MCVYTFIYIRQARKIRVDRIDNDHYLWFCDANKRYFGCDQDFEDWNLLSRDFENPTFNFSSSCPPPPRLQNDDIRPCTIWYTAMQSCKKKTPHEWSFCLHTQWTNCQFACIHTVADNTTIWNQHYNPLKLVETFIYDLLTQM